jgi:hypothetical protein
VNGASCSRPACSGKPEAWLAYDYEARCAWLDDQPNATDDPSHRWPLCERHADNLRVPRGWFCVDRRAARGEVEDPDEGPQTATDGTADGNGAGVTGTVGAARDGGAEGISRGSAGARRSAIL